MSVSVPILYARYPFLEGASDAVEETADSFTDLVSEPVLERAEERVTLAVEEKTVGGITKPATTELFSYPVARAVVSVVDDEMLTRRYAWAEASTAYDRIKDDLRSSESFGSVESARLSLGDLIDEFGLEVREIDDGYEIRLHDYLELASGLSDKRWKLVNRAVDDGWVRIDTNGILILVREAIRDRVIDDLPLSIPREVEALVSDAVESVRETMSRASLSRDIDEVDEDEFPPCMKTLLAEVREGEHLEHHSRFAITTFLANIGMSVDEIIETYEVNPGFGEEMTRYQASHIQGETSPTEYTAPSCATMVTYGDCRNRDDLCDEISHPLEYYRRRLDEKDSENEDGKDDTEDTATDTDTEPETDGETESETQTDGEED
ncbi:MAG: DNA primase large subunit PriL [Halobacteria archaeon]|nr:DNA primase large subunit PriL [Halobacteria archaeon]